MKLADAVAVEIDMLDVKVGVEIDTRVVGVKLEQRYT